MQGIRRRWLGLQIAVLLGVVLASTVVAHAATGFATLGPWSQCDGPPSASSSICTPTELWDVDPQGRMVWLTAEVRFEGRSTEPAGVFIGAYASSAVYWDGRLIGMNGVPAEEAGEERPGLRDTAFALPGAASGKHKLVLQMSSHHGLLRLRSPVTEISVAPFDRPSSKVMRDYLPALISAGALLIMALIFAFAPWPDRQRTSNRYLLGTMLFAIGQLGAEASRAFLEYTYPLQLLRIVLVLVFATGFGFMLLAYLASRFGLARAWPILLVQAVSALLAITLVPSFDQRAALILTSAIATGLLLTVRAAGQTTPGTLSLAAVLALGLAASLAAPYSFLDRNLYIWITGLFALLMLEEAWRLKGFAPIPTERSGHPAPTPEIPRGVSLGTGTARHFVLPSDIIRLAAADDYTEVFLLDARALLHPEPLQSLLARLPATFIRVHRSHAVNLTHLRAFRKGPVSTVVLADASTAPVSRRNVTKLAAALKSSAEPDQSQVVAGAS